MNIADWLRRTAAASPGRVALFSGTDQVADYAGFYDQARRVAGWLAARGVGPGDRVGLFLKNCPEYLILQYGIWVLGAAAVPINGKLHGREVGWILENAEAELCFSAGALAEAVTEHWEGRCADIDELWPDVLTSEPRDLAAREPGDLAWLFYTSGTTGRPKGVMITHRMLLVMALSYFADVDTVTAEDTALYAAPMSHGAGLYNLMHVMKGARHVTPRSGSFDEVEIFALAQHHGRTHMFCAPTMVKRMVAVARAEGFTGEGLRTVVYGGGPMYVADVQEAVAQLGPVFVQIYGQGECPMCITALSRADVADRTRPGWQDRLASVGRVQSSVELAIGDAEGNPLSMGSTGEVMVRGDAVMPGYWRNPEATAETIRNGWLMTGDMGVLDAAGYLTLKDRSKDLIISGGSNVYPREVEEVLLEHPSVEEVAVIGRPHHDWGEEVVAFVVPTGTAGGMDQAALEAHCRDHMGGFKRPKAYFEVTGLPKNNYGKVLKTELRGMLEQIGEG